MAAGFSVLFHAFIIALVPATLVGLGSYGMFRRWPHLGERRQK
jgi:hypothetical protein